MDVHYLFMFTFDEHDNQHKRFIRKYFQYLRRRL